MSHTVLHDALLRWEFWFGIDLEIWLPLISIWEYKYGVKGVGTLWWTIVGYWFSRGNKVM